MSSPGPQLTPQQRAQLPHEDKAHVLLGAHWGLTALATVFLGLRVYCKRVTGRRLLWDDWILIASLLTILTTDALTTALVTQVGLGKHSWDLAISSPSDLSSFLLLLNSRATVTLTSIGWTKTAFAVTLLRFATGWTRNLVWFIIVSLTVTTGISAAVPWIQCTPISKTWDPARAGHCWAPGVGTKIWIAMGAYSAFLDFTLAALPWTFLYKLLLREKEKLGILIAMSMGAIAGGVAIAKCVYLPTLASGDIYRAVELFIWDVTESTVTIIAACIPNLRVLIRVKTMHSSSSRTCEQQLSDISFSLRDNKGFENIEEGRHSVTELRDPNNIGRLR